MTTYEARQMKERLEQQDSNIWFMSDYFEEKQKAAELAGNTEVAAAYAEISQMIEHVKDDESLKKVYMKARGAGDGQS